MNCVFQFQSQFYAIDTRPNSLSGSLAKIGAQPEAKVCKRTWSLPKESSDLLEVSLALDSLLANTNEKIEKLYVVIGKLLKVINLEKKLDKQLRRIYLDALQSLITLLNKMYYYMQAQLVGLDATLTTIIILQVSSLNWVSGLDCKCACPIPKLGCELTQSTADALKECTVTERDALVDLLDTACNDLNTVLKHGLKKVGLCSYFAMPAAQWNV